MGGPPISSSDDRARTWLLLAGGIVVTVALIFGLVQLWPDDDDPESVAATETPATTVVPGPAIPTVPGAIGEPSDLTSTTSSDGTVPAGSLFQAGAADAIAELADAAGGPTQVLEIAVYDRYAFLAYRDPANPGNIDRRMWRDGDVDDAEPNPIDDRADADTEPSLFSLDELDLSLIPTLSADAVTRYSMPVEVSHILIDRFLPFDERVLIRVYATPTDGRSGGGYVSYDTAGTFVEVCC
jgi:hypothetical protein